MQQELLYREAQISDLERLLELEQAIVEAERPYDSALKSEAAFYYDIPALISDSDSLLMVADSGDGIVGSGYGQLRNSKDCHQHDRHCYLGFIYVDAKYRGQGVASRILSELKDWSTSGGVNCFYLDVYAANESAIRAYEKAGFSTISVTMELLS